MTSIVLAASDGAACLLDALDRLTPLLDELTIVGDPADLVIAVRENDGETLGLAHAVYGARLVEASVGSTQLGLWLAGAANAEHDEVWLTEVLTPPTSTMLLRLRHGLHAADATFGMGHCLLAGATLREVAEGWQARDPRTGGCFEQLWNALKAEGRRPLSMDDVPHIDGPLGMDATIYSPEPSRITVGRHTIAQPTAVLRAFHYTEIAIGAFCSISWEVLIANHGATGARLLDDAGRPVPTRLTRFAGGHHPETATTFPLSEAIRPDPGVVPINLQRSRFSRPLTIGNDVWIGVGAKVLGGVSIGHGAVVGAGAVVLADVPAYAVVMGHPASVVRYRFSPPVVEQLLRIAWWNWPDELIAERAQWFTRPIGEFVAEFGDSGRDIGGDVRASVATATLPTPRQETR